MILALLLAATTITEQPSVAERRIRFWPDAVPETIQNHVDGVRALEAVRSLGRFHRVHGSPGFAAAAEYVRAQAEAAGLTDAKVEHLPADGTTRYGHFVSYYGWDARSGSLEELSPRPGSLASFPGNPVALADYSQDADVTAELMDVGRGTEDADYVGREVAGKILLASGPLPEVNQQAVLKRGAAGFVSDYPNQTTAWSGDDRDLVRWGHLSPYETRNRFAFMVSKRQSQGLRDRLAAGETIRLRAKVAARMMPATYDVVNATIPGTDAAAGEIVLTAHLCHQSAGANDNASGSAAILEVARALQGAVTDGSLPRPRLTIRFLWLPEIAGAQAWLIRNPAIAERLRAGIHMDMVGGLLATTKGTFHLSRTAGSLPHAINAVAQAWFDDVVAASSRYAERGGDPRAGLAWLPGSREAFLGDVRGLELGSDHEVFQEGTFKVPMAYFHDWPDVNIHTNKDQPENLDATKLGRVAYMGSGIAWTLAALPATEVSHVRDLVAFDGNQRHTRAALQASTSDPRDAAVLAGEAKHDDAVALESLASLWPADDSTTAASTIPRPQGPDRRVPMRSPEVRGPLGVYYYDHLTATLGHGYARSTLEKRSNGDVLTYEALNLVDSRRTVSDIRDRLRALYGPVTDAEVGEYLDLLVKARVLSWKN